MTGLKAFPKNAISLDRGKREVAWEPKLYIYSRLTSARIGTTRPPPTVVNMEQANPLLGQWKIMKNRENKEKTIKNNRDYVNE